MIKKYLKIILLVWLVAMIMLPHLVLAVDTPTLNKLQNIGAINGPYELVDENNGMFNIISTVISGALSLLGVIFLVLMLYAGYNWMMARGDEEKVTKAKETITRAIVGIIIVVGAYAISIFVMGRLEKGTLDVGSGTGISRPC